MIEILSDALARTFQAKIEFWLWKSWSDGVSDRKVIELSFENVDIGTCNSAKKQLFNLANVFQHLVFRCGH